MQTPAPYLHRAASDRPYFSADGETYLAPTPCATSRSPAR